MKFEKGNKGGAKAKLFDGALKRAIAQDDGQRLRDCAEKLLDLAAAGEPWAVKELADRLDGRAAQSVEISDTRDVSDLSTRELFAHFIAARAAEAGDSASDTAGLH